MGININCVINNLKQKRQIFVSEADLQLEVAWAIKELYPNVGVRCEYSPSFNPNMHIDILVIDNGRWIPIELKYKTKACHYVSTNETIILKNQAAKDQGCYSYLKDIERIEYIKANCNLFEEGYTIFITNDSSYKKSRQGVYYKDFALDDDRMIKTGALNWNSKASSGTTNNCNKPIVLNGKYPIKWNPYSSVKDVNGNNVIFECLVNKVV